MIERFSIGTTSKALAKRFGVEEPSSFQARYNVAPSQLIPIISMGDMGFSHFYWGQHPDWSKNKALAEKIINVRSEQIVERPALKKALMTQRCIVPADGFYVWKRHGKKSLIPWRFSLRDKSIFSIAALWEEYDDEEGDIHTFTILTRSANNFVSSVSERMPMILNPETEKIWLDKNSSENNLLDILNSESIEVLDGYAVSNQLNSISFDRPSLVLPVPPADQFGNLTLFD
ncbi:DUF159 family protein [Cytophagales bacterium WSM2-2]|nr:DUF159 family protein [Cytophagales bacterium WSM2-2]